MRVYLDTGVFIDYLSIRGTANAALRTSDRRGRAPLKIAQDAGRLLEKVSRSHTGATSCLTYYEVEEALYRLLVQTAKGVSGTDTLLIPVARSITTQVQIVVERFNITVLDLNGGNHPPPASATGLTDSWCPGGGRATRRNFHRL